MILCGGISYAGRLQLKISEGSKLGCSLLICSCVIQSPYRLLTQPRLLRQHGPNAITAPTPPRLLRHRLKTNTSISWCCHHTWLYATIISAPTHQNRPNSLRHHRPTPLTPGQFMLCSFPAAVPSTSATLLFLLRSGQSKDLTLTLRV